MSESDAGYSTLSPMPTKMRGNSRPTKPCAKPLTAVRRLHKSIPAAMRRGRCTTSATLPEMMPANA
eukprot:scaffold56865_cov71-Phaeocystis_antarctica.AAC.5